MFLFGGGNQGAGKLCPGLEAEEGRLGQLSDLCTLGLMGRCLREFFSTVLAQVLLSRCLYTLACHGVFSLCDLLRVVAPLCLSFLSASRSTEGLRLPHSCYLGEGD